MILHRIRLESYRGIECAEITLAPRGITLIEGPNEIGKSSLAEALEIVLAVPDSSRSQEVRALQPVHRDAGPRIEVELETGPYHLVVRKRYLKRPATELEIRTPRRERHTGREAHDRLVAILDETLDRDLFRALQVVQGRPAEAPPLGDNASLRRALDAAAGGGLESAGDGELFDRVEREYLRYWTRTGRPGREQEAAAARVQGLERDVGALAARLRELEGVVAEHERVSGRLSDVAAALPRLEEAAEQARKEAEEVAGWIRQVEERRAEVTRAREAATEARRRAEERESEVEAIRRLEDELARLREGAGEDGGRALAGARAAFAQARENVAKLRDGAGEAEAQARIRGRDHQAGEDRLACQQLEERRARLETLERRREEAQRVAARVRVDRRALAELQEADVALRLAQERLQDAGVQIAARALEPVELVLGEETVELGSGEERTARVTDPATWRVGTSLELRIDPGRGLGQLRVAFEEAQRHRDRLFQEAGVANLDAAVQAEAALREAHRVLEEVEDQRRVNLRDLSFDELGAKIVRLRERLRSYEAERPAEPEPAAGLEEARARKDAAEEAWAALRRELERAEQELEAVRSRLEVLERAAQERTTEIEVSEARRRDCAQRLEEARSRESDADLSEAASRADQRQQETERQLTHLEAILRERNPEGVEARARTTREALERARQEHGELDRKLAQLQGRLEADQESGLAEQLGGRQAELEHARDEQARLQRRAGAASMLYETLRRARDEAREAYVAPLRERIERLGGIVYGPSFEVELDRDLTIAARTLGDITIPFTSLSTGAREQLGILVRLAAAQIVAADGGVPVILDDTLGNTDPERLPAMGAVLGSAARDGQVLVLTCFPDRFRSLGAARTVRLASS